MNIDDSVLLAPLVLCGRSRFYLFLFFCQCAKFGKVFLAFPSELQLSVPGVTLQVALVPLQLVQQINLHSGPLAQLSSNASEAEGI